tara:strand:+ start:591 stop:788 length:198 start_codon:yes stop_codon:yes gene_type:complete
MARQITVSEFAIENLLKRGITPPKELYHDAIREENNPHIKNELVLYNYKQCKSICKTIGAPCTCL